MKKNSSGITLIALVITIIVMLILAGVSLNALVGDNGILKQAQYASFLSEMSAVEEAVQLWKVNQEGNAIPAKGIVQSPEIDKSERIGGEVGYYRVWSTTQTMPSDSIMLDANTFNNKFGGELIHYPGGIQDLYYLDNEGLDLKNNKKYLIDAVNSMVYSVNGIMLNGVRCYSLEMAKAVMSGTYDMPQFAEAEVSGSQANGGKVAAGNTEPEFLEDGSPNPNYNPNGFQIIADSTNDNIYKLYNNGDLYAKGKKGVLLNTSTTDMENINPYKWSELNIPNVIPGNKGMFVGSNVIYVIDNNDDLWAWGNNDYNKLGLTQEQNIEYTGREPVKLNVNGQKVSKVFPTRYATFVVTTKNELYACGYNQYGNLGTNKEELQNDKFDKVEFENPQDITKIFSTDMREYNIIITGSGESTKIYFAGTTKVISSMRDVYNLFINTPYQNTNIKKFIEINNGTYGPKHPTSIKKYDSQETSSGNIYAISENGKLYKYSFNKYEEVILDGNEGMVTDVKTIFPGAVVIRKELSDGKIEFWGCSNYSGSEFFLNMLPENGKWYKLNDYFPSEYKAEDVKDFEVSFNGGYLFLMKNGKIFGCGNNGGLGINVAEGSDGGFIDISAKGYAPNNITEFFTTNTVSGRDVYLKTSDGKIYGTNKSDIIFRDNVLETSWKLIASNVKYFNAKTSSNCIAYIDKQNDIWVAGEDTWVLGMNTESVERKPNFVRLKDSLQGLPIYSNIDGKCVKYQIASKKMYILTNDEDNNSLYVSGHYLSYSWTPLSYLGTGENEHCLIPTKILENCEDICMNNLENLAIKNIDGKYELWYWGKCDGSAIPSSSTVPIKWSNGDSEFEGATEVKALCISYDKSYISVTKGDTSNLYVCGRYNYNGDVNGLTKTVTTYTNVPYEGQGVLNNFQCGLTANSFIFVANKINVFGFGKKYTLGLGTMSAENYDTPTLLDIQYGDEKLKINSISGGNGFYILVTEEGRVFGTGSNKYGTLGRWKGASRNLPNSRYRTAYEWVECPELEI